VTEQTGWYHSLETDVEALKVQLGADARDFYLERFLKVAWRVDGFAEDCQQCREHQFRMVGMQEELSANIAQLLKEHKRNFLGNTSSILAHLKKAHGLISDGQNTGIWLAIGAGIGVALGATFHNPVIGIATGVGLGLVIGISLDAQARKAGKVI